MLLDAVADLSHWNTGPLDFAVAKAAGIAAAILKASQGSDGVDPAFADRATAAAAAGLLVGAYHFLDGSNPAAQADHFLATVAGRTPVLALDLERNPGGTTASAGQAAQAAGRLKARQGRPPLLYVGRYFAGLPQPALTRCPLWLPEYGTNPVCPPGWSSWLFWQYTDSGDTPGIGRCDRSRFAGDDAALAQWWASG